MKEFTRIILLGFLLYLSQFVHQYAAFGLGMLYVYGVFIIKDWSLKQ